MGTNKIVSGWGVIPVILIGYDNDSPAKQCIQTLSKTTGCSFIIINSSDNSLLKRNLEPYMKEMSGILLFICSKANGKIVYAQNVFTNEISKRLFQTTYRVIKSLRSDIGIDFCIPLEMEEAFVNRKSIIYFRISADFTHIEKIIHEIRFIMYSLLEHCIREDIALL